MSVNTKINGDLVRSAGLYKVSAPIGMADIYSTEEKEVGLWKNKPLYQKTIIIGNGDVNVNQGSAPNFYAVVDTGISDIDEAFGIIDKSYMILSSDNSLRFFSWVDYQGLGSSEFVLYSVISRTNVTVVLTIQYTKTTDTPWSGKFVPQGYGYVSSGDIYSEQERQVGVFADGKPLYQKTVDCGALPANTTKNVAHGITNIDRIVSVSGCAFRSTSGNETGIPLPSTHYQTIGNQNEVSVNFTNVVLRNGNSGASSFDETQVTIQYTKTTDVAGSGEYVPSGDKAVHYSTEEEVIGTFLGETLYRKVITGLNLQTAWQGTYYPNVSTSALISDTKDIINARAIHNYDNGVSRSHICSIVTNSSNNTWALITSDDITINTLVVEYTKTS